MIREVVIAAAARTPIGSYLGVFREVPAYELGAVVLNEAVRRANIDPALVEEVIMGQSYQSGEYVNIARMALLTAGWPVEVPGITFDRRCCSGLDTVCYGAMKIMCWEAEIVVAGRDREHEHGRVLRAGGIHKVGRWRKKGPQMGLHAQGARLSFHVGHAVLRSDPEGAR